MDVKVEGADKLALLGKAIRKMGSDRTIIKNLSKEIKSFGPPVREALKASALATLPKRGGLNKWVAASRVNVSVRRGATTAGVSIKEGRNSAGGRSDLKGIDAGMVRHPLLGNRAHWYPQRITPGFATKTLEGPVLQEFQQLTVKAIDEAISEVLRGI